MCVQGFKQLGHPPVVFLVPGNTLQTALSQVHLLCGCFFLSQVGEESILPALGGNALQVAFLQN